MSEKKYRIPNIKFEKGEAYNKAFEELERLISALNLTPGEKRKLWHSIKKLNGETARAAKSTGTKDMFKDICKALRERSKPTNPTA